MPDTIHFTLHNNYSNDLMVGVYDTYGGVDRQTWTGPLNKDESTSIEVYANSDGRGNARWESVGGPAGSGSDINDGDTCEVNP
ncbi:MAG: hypothetical protein LAO24_13005 [Acidobacteriia bacterium]|nr:hypothetical protein [Terriglobia bacterium]